MTTEYHKIYGPFKRHTSGPDRNKLIFGDWSKPEFAATQNLDWTWTEKLDGTNIRVEWNGHRVWFNGRTDKAQIPAKLVQHLQETFTEELMEQTFGSNSVTLYGEGVGAGIQKGGGNYGSDQRFILFDVNIDQWWLERVNVAGVADSFGVPRVPVILEGPVDLAIEVIRGGLNSHFGDFIAEGLVGTPMAGLLNRAGERIIMKIKTADFKE